MRQARIGTVLFVAWMVAAGGACQDVRWPAWLGGPTPAVDGGTDATVDEVRSPLESGGRSPSDRPIAVELHFDVMRVDLPVASARHSAKVWNHVDELRIDPGQSALLGRNGFRVGVAPADVWPAVRAVLEAHDARAARRQHVVQPGYPLTLDIGDARANETIFSYDGQGRLKGRTFGAGRKYLHLDYAVEAEDPPQVLLRVTPEVHVQSPDKRWQNDGGEYVEKPVYEGHSYTELSTALSLRPGQILVVGPGPQAEMAHVLGNRFFERIEGGRRYETLYFVTPQLFRSEATE